MHRCYSLRVLWLALLFAPLVIMTACRAEPVDRSLDPLGPFTPPRTFSLLDFGAVGDGRTDDTVAVQKALASSNQYCLDGEGRHYRVTGTLRAGRDLCLRNVSLTQTLVPPDTSAWIHGGCPAIKDPSIVLNCGDSVIPLAALGRLQQSLSVRTLFIRPDNEEQPVRVYLENVTVDRGRFPEGGSRTDSAGIWLDDAKRVDFRNVEITGDGKGFGLIITRSRNVSLNNLSFRDLHWAPYPGDAPLDRKAIESNGWNSVPIREFREAGPATPISKFYGVRVQEQLSCLFLSDVHDVRIENMKIERCLARFADGDLPWQSDGAGIAGSASDVGIYNSLIDSTWEGLDANGSGAGISNLTINGVTVRNSFSFGLKLGHKLSNVHISDARIDRAALTGIVIYGAARNAEIHRVAISNVGWLTTGSGEFAPWPRAANWFGRLNPRNRATGCHRKIERRFPARSP